MTEQLVKILIVSQDQELIGQVTEQFTDSEDRYRFSSLSDYHEIINAMGSDQYDLYLIDQDVLSGKGLRLITSGKEQGSQGAFLFILRQNNISPSAIIEAGADDYLAINEISNYLRHALEHSLAVNHKDRDNKLYNDYMRVLWQSQSVGMLLVAEDMTVKMANSYARHIAGFSSETDLQHRSVLLGELINCRFLKECKGNCSASQNSQTCQIFDCVRQAISTGKAILHQQMELVFATEEPARKIWARVSAKPVHVNGQRLVVLTIDDLTAQHEIEVSFEKSQAKAREDHDKLVGINEQLKLVVSQTNEMVQEAFAASNAKNNFIANVSHELRTPLNGIQGFCQLLLEEELSPGQRDYAQTILGCTKDLVKVLNNVLEFTRLENNSISLIRSWFNIEDIIDDMTLLYKGAAEDKGLQFKIATDLHCPHEICSDQGKLKKALMNIVDNAIKYTDQGAVEIHVSSIEIEDSVFVCFEVIDTGIGMSIETSSKIFESFSQADTSSTRQYDGLGLGLSVSKRYIELLGGKIEVDSTENEGSRFTLVVPVDRKIKRVRLSDRIKSDRQSRGVLVAESQNCHAEIISRYLTQLAVKVDIVSNGEDAIERLVSYSYDYVLLDMSMPELCDESVLEVIQEVNQLFPVVALCHERSKHVSDLCTRIGIKDILTRPIDKARLDALTIEYCKVAQDVIEANLDLDAQDFFTNIAEEPLLVSADGQVSAIDDESLPQPIYSSLANDPEMHEIIVSFLEMLPDYLDSLKQAVDNGSPADIIPVAFDFRDSAGTAGYKELRLLVLALEKAAQANDLETVGQLFTRVVETAGRMKTVTDDRAIANC